MNKILSSLVIIVATTSVARADIASTQYVDDKALTKMGNMATPIYITSEGKAEIVTSIASSLLPMAHINTENEQPMIYPGALKSVFLGKKSADDDLDFYTAEISSGNVYIPLAHVDEDDWRRPGIVTTVHAGEDWEAIRDDFWDPDLESGAAVPTVDYMNEQLAKKQNIVPKTGTSTTPVYFSAAGTVKKVTSIASSLLPAGNDKTKGAVIVDSALSTTSANPVQNQVVTNALNSKQNKILAPTENGYDDEIVPVDGLVVVDSDGNVSGKAIAYDSSCSGSDNTVCYVSGIGIDTEHVAVFENQITFGTNITVDEGDIGNKVISVPTATVSKPGVAALGVIPAGTDKAGTATIWIE
ncbi:MAG: hypothetical protein E7006_04620 [Alphaproteobacteria bacterium]|nr:hypothetical protein [Alphaproteobacteria bacterium]